MKKTIKEMSIKEMTGIIRNNHIKMRTASLEERRRLIIEDHELMTEIDRRWQEAKAGRA